MSARFHKTRRRTNVVCCVLKGGAPDVTRAHRGDLAVWPDPLVVAPSPGAPCLGVLILVRILLS